jgi:predicted metal-dependent phosphoesterase TrpH
VPAISIRADDRIDLQLHTIYSDGRWTPRTLFDYLAPAGFRVAAVTDHDSVDHVPEVVEEGARRGVHVIAAVEVTTDWGGRMAHLLCYAPAQGFTGDGLARLVRQTVAAQLENTRAVRRELERRGYGFPRAAEVLGEQGGASLRPGDNATLLLAHGHAPSMAAALDMIADAGFRSVGADLGTAVAAAHAADAVALIAHPGRREAGFTLYDPALLDAVRREVPLDGIEARHPSHTPEQVAEYDRYAQAHGWLRGAGSDSHGLDHRRPIPYPAGVARALLERCGVRVEG